MAYSKKPTLKTNRRRTYRPRKTIAKKTYNAITKVVKKQLFKHVETKHINVSLGKTELYHNTYTNLGNPFSACYPSQGTGDSARIGDKIDQRGLLIRMMFGQKADRPNVTFKIWLLQVAKQTAYTPTTLWDQTTGNLMLDSVNPDQVKVVYHKTFAQRNVTHNLGAAGAHDRVENTFPFKVYIKRPKTITFSANGGTDQGYSDYNYFLVVGSYDAYGTLITDNIAYVQTFLKYYYKDP